MYFHIEEKQQILPVEEERTGKWGCFVPEASVDLLFQLQFAELLTHVLVLSCWNPSSLSRQKNTASAYNRHVKPKRSPLIFTPASVFTARREKPPGRPRLAFQIVFKRRANSFSRQIRGFTSKCRNASGAVGAPTKWEQYFTFGKNLGRFGYTSRPSPSRRSVSVPLVVILFHQAGCCCFLIFCFVFQRYSAVSPRIRGSLRRLLLVYPVNYSSFLLLPQL